MLRVHARCLAVVLGASFACIAQAARPDPPQAPPATQPVSAAPYLSDDQSLKQLSNADWRQRRQGMQELLRAGDEAQAVLTRLLRRDLDQETRKNVETALRMVRDNRVLGASLITLHVKDAAPAQVFAAIASQCRGVIPVEPDDLWKQKGWPKLTVDFDRRPFWKIVPELGAKLGLEYLSSDPDELRLMRGSDRPDSVYVAGAFLLTANAVAFRNRLVVEFGLYGEPKISVLRTGGLKVSEGVDDQGKRLLPQTGRFFGRGLGRFRRRGRSGRPLSLLFQRPADNVSHVSRLKGSVTAYVPTATDVWEVADPLSMASATRVIDSVPVTLQGLTLTPHGDVYELQLMIPWSSRGAQQDEIMEMIRNRLKLLDTGGRALAFSALDSRSAADGTEILADFAPAPAAPNAKAARPVKLVWKVPSQVRTLVIPFDFKDVAINDPWN